MGKLKVGFSRILLDPPLGLHISGYYNVRAGSGVLDDLTASCIAFSDGERTAVIIGMDVIGIEQSTGDRLREVVSERTGLPADAILYSCTHTHTAPGINDNLCRGDDIYNNVLFRRLGDLAAAALEDLSDAELYGAHGSVEGIAFIRRFRMKNGNTQTNPGFLNPDIVAPISTPDETLQLLRIIREGKNDVVLINFQVHPDVVGGTQYSADYPGWVRRSFEGAVSGTKCVYFNGTQGDTNHIDFLSPAREYGYAHSRHMGLTIAAEAMKLYSYPAKIEGDRVDYCLREVMVPANLAPESALPQAERFIALHEAGKDDEIPFGRMELITVVAEAYRIRRRAAGEDSIPLHLSAVRFGNAVLTGFPGEPFTDVGRAVRAASPFSMTMTSCCANGYEGYFPMKDAFAEGGYEARSSDFHAGVAELLAEETKKMLQELYRKQ